MKQVLMLITGLFLLTSCSQDDIDKTLKPHQDKDNHYILWQYPHGMEVSDIDYVPASDNNGHLFFSTEGSHRSYNAKVIALNEDGTELWSKEYTATNYTEISKIMYKNNKVYFSTYQVGVDFTYVDILHCLNANNGSEIWSFSPTEEYYQISQKTSVMAINNDKLVVVAGWRPIEGDGGENLWRYIHYFNLNTGEVTAQYDIGIYNTSSIALSDNSLFICHYDDGIIDSQSTQTYISKINMDNNAIEWQYIIDMGSLSTLYTAQRNIAIDSNNNVVLLTQTGTPSTFYLNSINSSGILNYSKVLSTGNHKTTDLLLFPDNSIYDEHRGKKYDPSGNLIWEIEEGNGLLRYENGAMIGSNNYIYHADDDLTVVKPNGDIDWMYYKEDKFSNLCTPILTSNGNVVVMGKDYITCIKGDGATESNSSWARPFGDNGNTSSK